MYKKLWVLSLGMALSACQSQPSKPVTEKAEAKVQPKTVAPTKIERPRILSLAEMIRTETDEQKLIEALKKHRGSLGKDSKTDVPLIAYLVAVRSPEAVQIALAKGTDPTNSIEFAQIIHGLQVDADTLKQGRYFSFKGDAQPITKPLTASEKQELVEKFTLVRAYQAELALRDAYIPPLNQEQQQWQAEIKQQIAQLEQPVAEVPQPTLPPIETHQKSPFETLAMFQQRMKAATEKREQQTQAILEKYRKKVEARNQKVQQKTAKLQALQQSVAKQKQVFAEKRAALPQKIADELAAKQQGFIAQSMAEVYGSPIIESIVVNGQPKYDAEKGLMFAKLSYANLQGEQEVTFPVPAGPAAADFYAALKDGKLTPKAVFQFADDTSGKVLFDRLQVDFNSQKYLASFDGQGDFIAQKPIQVVLQEATQAPVLQQDQMEAVKFDQTALANLQLQNPNVKDVQFEAYVLQQQKAFNDDIPQLFNQVAAAPIDRKKWLFVVGVGQYEQTDDILYSKRSAEWFAKTAAKTLGVQKGRQIVLLDKQATSGAIKDQLKLMLSKVKAGDEIIFYYSGHGLPVVEKGNQPYLLPTDKIPDFIADDDFYQAKNIYRQLMNSQASSVVAFMDSCFTGQTDGKSVFGGSKAATRLQPKSFKPSTQGKMAIFTAGNDKQFSNAYGEKGHRLFSYYLIKGMLKGYDQVGDLATKVKAEVNDTSLDMGGLNRQTPVFVGNPKLKL